MISYEFLQQYWWFIISLLGGLLVFLMFVQGGNALLFELGSNEREKKLIINSTGRKWEFTFTTLVTFGGAFFASFPLFYSTSFGGAYWVWILILVTFVLQAVAYEFQHRTSSNGIRTFFRVCLVLNGVAAPFLIGAAVSTFFTGSDFIVNRDALTSAVPVISEWGNSLHGIDALYDLRNWGFALMMVFLAQTLGILYMLNNIGDAEFCGKLRRKLRSRAAAFVVLFLVVAFFILTADGFAVDAHDVIFIEPYKYLHNLIQMPVVMVMFIVGVALVLCGIAAGLVPDRGSRRGIWLAGPGTVLTVVSLFLIIGYNHTSFYPSHSDLQSSLTISNSCSSYFTLKTMAFVSLAIPFVLAYIAYAWRAIDLRSITHDEIEQTEDRY